MMSGSIQQCNVAAHLLKVQNGHVAFGALVQELDTHSAALPLFPPNQDEPLRTTPAQDVATIRSALRKRQHGSTRMVHCAHAACHQQRLCCAELHLRNADEAAAGAGCGRRVAPLGLLEDPLHLLGLQHQVDPAAGGPQPRCHAARLSPQALVHGHHHVVHLVFTQS